ncbi:mitochondrial amidoxime-reducing component 1-like [Temnothorax nylanderi]|uniref:mitochondrial amidoxime-reducing component 1-like n=1 Tax=Temnothorax nylanderi TaxID=102681 RepID=UPI003A871882
MTLLKTLSSIITITGCVLITFLIRRKITFKKLPFNFAIFRKAEKEEKDDSQHHSPKWLCPNWLGKPYVLTNPNWIKVGHVERLYIEPLNSGEKVSYPTLKFTNHGIIVEKENSVIWDRMFQIYNEETKELQSSDNLEDILLICTEINEPLVNMHTAEMSDLTIDLNKVTSKTGKIVAELKTHWIVIRYVDCGDEAAAWMNEYFRKSTLRLLRAEYDIIGEREADLITDAEAWKLMMLTRYTVITSESLKEYDKGGHLKFFKIQPNILISASPFPAYAEKDWDWMMIGNVILKKIIPAKRYACIISHLLVIISRSLGCSIFCADPKYSE